MDILQLQKTYNLDFKEIADVLKKHKIIIKQPQLIDIPEKWVLIIENHLKVNTAINLEDDQPQAEQPHIDIDNKNKREKTNRTTPLSSSQNTFYAYVKYIGLEKDHAFIQKIPNINALASQNLTTKDYNSYKLINGCSSIVKDQIILCSLKSRNHQTVEINSTVFQGSLSSTNIKVFTDWTSFESPKIIKNIKSNDFAAEEVIVSVQLYWNRNQIICKNANVEVNTDAILPKVDSLFQKYLLSAEIKENDITSIYKSLFSIEAYEMILRQRFNTELNDKSLFSNNDKIIGFIKKWELLAPTLVTYVNIGKEKYFDLFFQMWLHRKNNLDFWGEHLIDACIQYQLSLDENKNNEEKVALSYALTPDHLSKIESFLPLYFNHELIIESLKTRDILKNIVSISNIPSKEVYYRKLNNSLSEPLKFQLWLDDEVEEFPKSLALEKFAELNVEKQVKVIEILVESEIVEVLQDVKFTGNESHYSKLFNATKIKLFEVLNPVSFDIESDIESIRELAWNNNDEWHYYNTPALVADGLKNFKEATESHKNTLIGHNIIDFDCPILEKRGVRFREEQLWDTYRIEALLSPDLKHYALITKHNAKSDAQLTLDLFINQILRILILPADRKNNLYKYLSKRLIIILEDLSDNLSFPWASEELLLKNRQKFYRPQSKIHKHIIEAIDFVSNSKAQLKLIVGPPSFKNKVLSFESIGLLNFDDKLDFRLLDKISVEENDQLDIWLKSVLLNFLIYSDSNRINPYWDNLPVPIKIQLEKGEIDVYTLLVPLTESSTHLEGTIFVTTDELFSNKGTLEEAEEIDVLIIQPELITVTQKKLLKDLEINDFKHLIKDHDFWLKFSGGQSYVSLTKKQCVSFNIEIPLDYTNFWIEKYQIGKYRIWANSNWEDVLKALPINNQKTLSLNAKDLAKDQTVFVRANFSTTKKDQILRINPESIYRSRYWAFQKELIKQILTSKKSSILLIQSYSEIEILEDYFRAMAYYIPKRGASLARRLELLDESKDKLKLIIERIGNIDKVINANYLGELNVIIDSFNLAENFYISQNTNLLDQYYKNTLIAQENSNKEFNDDIDTENDIEDQNPNISIGKKPMVKDSFLLLSLHLPQINYYRDLLITSNPNHTLYILDSRIDDFPGLNKIWNAYNLTLSVHHEDGQYEKDLKLADQYIQSVKPSEDIPFNTEETKKILSRVFLNGETWYDYQEPYLDLIIPGQTDELITLPTGGGKSLLFQAPALFKSAFTNKLTIVVTPLKALMEDQVSALWEKGFFGSVEYLNSDRGSDVQLIYKAMAGGELALLFVTPERFRSRAFLNALNVRIQSDGGLEYFVFDEAHCVSQWGHEFRPDYFNCAKTISYLKKSSLNNTPLLLFSATVSQKIFTDFKRIFA